MITPKNSPSDSAILLRKLLTVEFLKNLCYDILVDINVSGEKIMAESSVTKKAIADGFKKIMTKRSFEKITIADITSECGLNRQTFYYHFQDKYELLNWIFYTDVIMPLTDGLTIENWSEKLLKILLIIKDNAKFYTNAINTPYGDEFRDYFLKVITKVLDDILGQLTQGYSVNEPDIQFLSEFFAYGISGSVIKWIQTGMKESPEEISVHMKNLVNDFKSFAVTRYFTEK